MNIHKGRYTKEDAQRKMHKGRYNKEDVPRKINQGRYTKEDTRSKINKGRYTVKTFYFHKFKKKLKLVIAVTEINICCQTF